MTTLRLNRTYYVLRRNRLVRTKTLGLVRIEALALNTTTMCASIIVSQDAVETENIETTSNTSRVRTFIRETKAVKKYFEFDVSSGGFYETEGLSDQQICFRAVGDSSAFQVRRLDDLCVLLMAEDTKPSQVMVLLKDLSVWKQSDKLQRTFAHGWRVVRNGPKGNENYLFGGRLFHMVAQISKLSIEKPESKS